MPNPDPKTEQLSLGRGKRPTLNNETISMRMSAATRQELEKIAESYNCLYGDKPWIAGLLEMIGAGYLTVVPTPPYVAEPKPTVKANQALRKRMIEKYSSLES
jgi:hypothetical protein